MSMNLTFYVNINDLPTKDYFDNLSNTRVYDDGIGRYLTLDECRSDNRSFEPFVSYQDCTGQFSVLSLHMTGRFEPIARAAGVWSLLWDHSNNQTATQRAELLVGHIAMSLIRLRTAPEEYRKFDDEYARYDDFVIILEKILMAAVRFPNAVVYRHL